MNTPAAETDRLRVLLVEDEASVVSAVRHGFAASQIDLAHAATVAEGKRLLAGGDDFDAILLDLNLPDGDGAEIVDACRGAGNEVPVLMITARDSVDERIAGLSRGADDYICKPFAVSELSARLDAVLRRARPRHRHILRYDDVELDLLRRRVRRGDLEVTLSARELDFLAFLLCHPEEVISKERLLKEIWGDECEQDGNVLHVYANYLRNKLEQGLYPRLIHTVRGVGYVLSKHDPSDKSAGGR